MVPALFKRSRNRAAREVIMESIGLILLSRQSALQRQVEVIANNVANTNTSGYKTQRLLIQNDPMRTQFDDTLNFVIDRATLRDTNTGAMARTGNELDFALQGPGYFGVKTKQGIQYTRNGSFSLNSNGDLVTQEGDTVLSNDGQALNVPQDVSQLSIDANGRLLSDKGEIGRLKVAVFKQEQTMIESRKRNLRQGGMVADVDQKNISKLIPYM